MSQFDSKELHFQMHGELNKLQRDIEDSERALKKKKKRRGWWIVGAVLTAGLLAPVAFSSARAVAVSYFCNRKEIEASAVCIRKNRLKKPLILSKYCFQNAKGDLNNRRQMLQTTQNTYNQLQGIEIYFSKIVLKFVLQNFAVTFSLIRKFFQN